MGFEFPSGVVCDEKIDKRGTFASVRRKYNLARSNLEENKSTAGLKRADLALSFHSPRKVKEKGKYDANMR